MYPGHSNQMNGVPVKISEKYKPPKKLTLNQALVQRLANTEATNQLVQNGYDFSLERSVLQKLADWQQQRQQDSEARRERIRQRQEERQKLLEAKQKQMLTAVSYPSAEELSSDEDTAVAGDRTTAAATNVDQMNRINAAAEAGGMGAVTTAVPTIAGQLPFSPLSYYNKILEPTVMAANLHHKRNKSIGKSPNINYSDFENESSPFDNIELKTINDLDILAQVLNRTASLQSEALEENDMRVAATMANTGASTPINNANESTGKIDNYSSDIMNESASTPSQMTHIPANNAIAQYQYQYQQQSQQVPNHQSLAHQQQQQQQQHQLQHSQALQQHYYAYPSRDQQMSPETAMYQMTEYSNVNGGWPTTPNPGVHHPNHHIQHSHAYHANQHMAHGQYGLNATATTNTYQSAIAYDQQQMLTGGLHSKIVYSTPQQSAAPAAQSKSPQPSSTASKSKSVPNILRELNAESSANNRERNKSQTKHEVGAPITGIDGNANQRDNSECRRSARAIARKDTRSSRSFSELPPAAQKIATNISAMGFPIDRVARIAAKIGDDEKKIIEHLISIGELLDLGFDENKISDALLRFDNNKDRALDFLIS